MKRLRRLALLASRQTSVVYLLVNVIVFMLGVFLVNRGGSVDVGIGTSLLATGIAGWTMFLYIALNQEERERLERIRRFGLRDIFGERSVAIKSIYDERLRRSRQGIDILGFGLNFFREDYVQEFASWTERTCVRVLLIDPRKPYADARDSEEGQQVGTIRLEVEHFLESTRGLRTARPDHFQVRLYSALPSINLLRIDDEMFFGPYLMEQPSRKTPTLLLSRGILFDKLSAHFEALWRDDRSSPAPL